MSAAWGVAIDSRYDTCAFGDFDNDGRVDLYVNGTVTGGKSYRDYLFRNTGTRFEDVTPENIKALEADHGAVWADFDGDGDVDLALTGSQAGRHALAAAEPAARRSRAAVDRRFAWSMRGGSDARRAPRCGCTHAGTRTLIGTRLVDTGSGYDAQNDMPVHVGLGSVPKVDVEVTWPGGGRRRVTRAAAIRAGTSRVIVLK